MTEKRGRGQNIPLGELKLKELRRSISTEENFLAIVFETFNENPFRPDEIKGQQWGFLGSRRPMDVINELCDSGMLRPKTIGGVRHYQIIKQK